MYRKQLHCLRESSTHSVFKKCHAVSYTCTCYSEMRPNLEGTDSDSKHVVIGQCSCKFRTKIGRAYEPYMQCHLFCLQNPNPYSIFPAKKRSWRIMWLFTLCQLNRKFQYHWYLNQPFYRYLDLLIRFLSKRISLILLTVLFWKYKSPLSRSSSTKLLYEIVISPVLST